MNQENFPNKNIIWDPESATLSCLHRDKFKANKNDINSCHFMRVYDLHIIGKEIHNESVVGITFFYLSRQLNDTHFFESIRQDDLIPIRTLLINSWEYIREQNDSSVAYHEIALDFVTENKFSIEKDLLYRIVLDCCETGISPVLH